MKEVANNKIQSRAIDGIFLVVIFGIALSLRIIPMHHAVFGSGWVNFLGPDPWYHVRLIENLLHHFPYRINFDPYTFYPYGQDVWFAPFYDELIGFGAWVIGHGSPGLNTIYTVAAYFPAILGALVSVPVYFIGKALSDRKVGLLSALIVSILPGPFLMVSLLGYVDHHVAEILFSTTSILFLILALRQIKGNPIYFSHIRRGEWRLHSKSLVYALLSGIALGIYLLTWVGGLLFVFLFFCWAVVMYIIGHLKHESTDYICILGVPIFLVALLMIIPFLDQLAFGQINIISLVIGILVLPILSGISGLLESRDTRRAYYPLVLAGLGAIGLAGFYFINPSLVRSMLQQFRVFTPDRNLLTVTEVRPLFFEQGPFSLAPYWNNFTTSAIIAPIGFIFVLVTTIRKIEAEKILFLIWGLIMFVATTGQIRFAEYLTVVFALLGAFLIWKIVDWIPLILKYFEFKPRQETRKQRTKRKKERSKLTRGQQPVAKKSSLWQGIPTTGAYKYVYISLAVIVAFFLGIFPNIQPAIANASVTNAGVSQDWYNALIWMKGNTPEPFQDPSFFNALYQKPAEGKFNYPASAYGVMSWWDYGNYITEIAHRIPNANPNQSGAASAAAYFTAQDETKADQMLDRLGSKYVIIDLDMVTPLDSNYKTRMFADIATWAGQSLSQYCEIYFQQTNNKFTPVILYYPEYYYSMSTRLFNFHGDKVVPGSTLVISYKVDSGYKVIQSSQTFSTYEQAQAFIDSHPSSNYRIAGTSPFISPVPLEKLAHYEEVYKSQSYLIDKTNVITTPYVEIFKYTP